MRRNTGSMARLGSGGRFTAQAARRLLIALTILGVVTLSVGVGFSLVQRASAAAYDVCPAGPPTCTYSTIQDAIDNVNPTLGTPLTTIHVGPGTYSPVSPYTTLDISRSVTLIGPNHGIPGVSGSRGAEAIIDAAGNQYAVTVAATNVTLNGFEVTGAKGSVSLIGSAGITGSSADGAIIRDNFITNNWNGLFELDGATLTITENLIRNNTSETAQSCFGGSPYCNGIFIGGSDNTISITHNTIDDTDFAHFQRALSISPASSTTDVEIKHNVLFNSTTLGNLTGNFNHNTVTGGTFAVRLIGAVNNFGIEDNTFTGLYSSAVATQNSKAFPTDNTDLTVTGNTVTQDVGDLYEGQVYNNEPVVATFDFDYLSGTNKLADNTVNYSGSYNHLPTPSTSITSVEAVHLRDHVGSTINIGHNTFNGGGVGGASNAGIALDDDTTTPYVHDNIIRLFTDGVNDLTASVYTLGSNNCISGNSAWGYTTTNASAVIVNARHNWWGSPLGPSFPGPGTAIGFGNPVTIQVDPSNFLTSPPMAACGGPVTTNALSTVNPVPIITPFTVTADLSTTTTSNAPIASAYYTIDGITPYTSPVSMSASSGAFNTSNTMSVTANVSGYATTGTHTVCVFGIDIYGQVGAAQCFTLTVVQASTTTTVTSSDNPSTYGENVTFTITVASAAGSPTGTVTLMDGVNTLAGPLTLSSASANTSTATFPTSTLSVGTHPLVATYTPDVPGSASFKASTSATLNQVVNLVSTTTM